MQPNDLPLKEMRLGNKQVVITGAGSGVGKATTERTMAEGANVLALDLNIEPLQQLMSGAPQETSGSLRTEQFDVSSEADWSRLRDATKDASIDHLHLNAGIQSAPPEAPLANYGFSQLSLGNYRRMMGVNVDGIVLGLHFLLPKLKPGGSVVVTCSLAGIVPYDIDPLYSMSKHAVTGLVRSLKREFKERSLRINALCPGGIDTAIIPHAQRDGASDFMTPENIASEVIELFLTTESGATWAKVSQDKPAWVIHPPGKR